jgi:hypothetical protein
MATANNHKSNWQEIIADPKERRVFEGLANPSWDFRTIGGLAKETKLSEDDVARTLHKYPSLVRKSLVPDLKGQDLFTLSTHPVRAKEIMALLRIFLAKSVY